MKKFFILFTLAFVGGLGFAVYLSFQSQDLDDVAGRKPEEQTGTVVSIPKKIEDAAKSRQAVTITEKQVNRWLAKTLAVRQEGQFVDHVKMKGVWVRFSEEEGGRAEIIIEREVKDRPHTVSMFVSMERKKKENRAYTTYIHKKSGRLWGLLAVGGKFGQARVPQGFLFFSQSSFDSIIELFKNELEWIDDEIIRKGGGRITFEENQMRIDFPLE